MTNQRRETIPPTVTKLKPEIRQFTTATFAAVNYRRIVEIRRPFIRRETRVFQGQRSPARYLNLTREVIIAPRRVAMIFQREILRFIPQRAPINLAYQMLHKPREITLRKLEKRPGTLRLFTLPRGNIVPPDATRPPGILAFINKTTAQDCPPKLVRPMDKFAMISPALITALLPDKFQLLL